MTCETRVLCSKQSTNAFSRPLSPTTANLKPLAICLLLYCGNKLCPHYNPAGKGRLVGGLEMVDLLVLRQVNFAIFAHQQRHLRGFYIAVRVGARNVVPYFDAVHQLALGVAVFMMAAFAASKYCFHTVQYRLLTLLSV